MAKKLDMETIDNIRKERRKDQEERHARKATKVVTASIQTTQKSAERFVLRHD
jgi:hypothetical protein